MTTEQNKYNRTTKITLIWKSASRAPSWHSKARANCSKAKIRKYEEMEELVLGKLICQNLVFNKQLCESNKRNLQRLELNWWDG